MVPSNAEVYRVSFGDDLLRAIKTPAFVCRPNSKGLEKLKRFATRVSPTFPVQNTSYSQPLYVYYSSIIAVGQVQLARSLLGLLQIIEQVRRKKYNDIHIIDDYYRQQLKLISGYAFPRVFSESPGWMFFVHMHSLGGKAPYVKADIEEDIGIWVGDNKEFKDPEFVRERMASIIKRWDVSRDDSLFLPFLEYANDVLRWGTSGGAVKTKFMGEDFRTKWAWGFSHLTSNDGTQLLEKPDLYGESLKLNQRAKVALKEEATKTRPVITTPMSSYLRQSYLLYRWGKPPLNSPISSSGWLPAFQSTSYEWYGCLDGDRFDQTIPKWVILAFIDHLGSLNDECRKVADAEIEHLNELEIEWGDRIWKWSGGLLSGWRITSILGTVISDIVADFIIERSDYPGAFTRGALGDDLVLASFSRSMTPEMMTQAYNDFGLKANIRKTTSGKIGEFLRKTYSPKGVIGYPALALRTIIYANPWISEYNMEFEEEISNGWLTYYSRLLPWRTNDNIHRWIKKAILKDIDDHTKFRHLPWDDWLHTPISCGGGGPIEWSDPNRWTTIVRDKKQVPEGKRFYAALGLYKPTKISKRVDIARHLNYDSVARTSEKLMRMVSGFVNPHIPKNKNITRLLFDWFIDPSKMGTSIEKILGIHIPRGMRAAGKAAILDYILGQGKARSGLTSVQITKDTLSGNSGLIKFITRSSSISNSFGNIKDIGAAATVLAMHTFRDAALTYGTW